jgi:hypothetical protein
VCGNVLMSMQLTSTTLQGPTKTPPLLEIMAMPPAYGVGGIELMRCIKDTLRGGMCVMNK